MTSLCIDLPTPESTTFSQLKARPHNMTLPSQPEPTDVLTAKAPHTYPQRILLAVTGLTPQIITETLYALCLNREPAFVPTRIMLITTAEGAERARLTLLHPSQNHFGRFCADYGLTGQIQFNADDIHIIRDHTGQPLADIRTPADNAATANTIVGLLRQLTRHNDTALHVSIAGGRKTMGFYVGYALSLYGRSQDRLSHVLVTPAELESNRDFYYPPPQPQVLHHPHSEKPVSTEQAHIHLAEIPFVRMRHGLPDDVLETDSGFDALVDIAQQRLGSPELLLDLDSRRVLCGAVEIRLAPQVFSFYYWLATLACDCETGEGFVGIDNISPDSFLECYKKVVGSMAHDYEAAAHSLRYGFDKNFFSERMSRVNKALRKALGPAADHYFIKSKGKRPHTRYGIELRPEQIQLL
jgi:CRISPR-associated protein (TIGR02584 family)